MMMSEVVGLARVAKVVRHHENLQIILQYSLIQYWEDQLQKNGAYIDYSFKDNI